MRQGCEWTIDANLGQLRTAPPDPFNLTTGSRCHEAQSPVVYRRASSSQTSVTIDLLTSHSIIQSFGHSVQWLDRCDQIHNFSRRFLFTKLKTRFHLNSFINHSFQCSFDWSDGRIPLNRQNNFDHFISRNHVGSIVIVQQSIR